MASADPRDEFVNSSDGFIGVITIDPNGKEKAIAVRSGASVWLSESEQILTANAPRNDEDNPFTNGDLKLRTRAADIKNRRPIGTAQEASDGGDAQQDGGPMDEQTGSANGSSPEVVDLSAGDDGEQPRVEKSRAKADKERQAAEKKRQAEAKKQAEAGAVPVKEVGASVSPKGIPEVGKRAPGEEVGSPEAPAQGKPEE